MLIFLFFNSSINKFVLFTPKSDIKKASSISSKFFSSSLLTNIAFLIFEEVFLKLSYLHYERNTYYYGPDPSIPYNNYEEVKTFDIAPGVGVGRKWVNKKGWTFEYMIGFGRFLFANSGNDNPDSNYGVDDYRPEGTFKGGISIGKRF